MSAYIVATYDITNPEGLEAYGPQVGPTLKPHNVEVLVAEHDSTAIEGNPAKSTVVLRFDDRDAAMAWYNSDAYQAIISLRTDNTEGSMVVVDGIPGSG